MNPLNKMKFYFNKAQKSYDASCHLQREIGEKLIALIKQHTNHDAARMIDLGCGTGITTQKLAAQFHYHDFHAIDIADQLLILAKERLSHLDINVYESDFNQLPAHLQPFDIMYSNMALHWSTDFTSTLLSLRTFLHDKSTLAFSIPLAGTLTELKFNYALKHFLSLSEMNEMLHQCDFDVIKSSHERITLTFDDAISALKSIKSVGANYVGERPYKGLRGKSFLNLNMLKHLTYIVGYFIAKKRA